MAGTGFPVEAMTLTCHELEGEGRRKNDPHHRHQKIVIGVAVSCQFLYLWIPSAATHSRFHGKSIADYQTYLSIIPCSSKNGSVMDVRKWVQLLENFSKENFVNAID